jgi:hypothetical protein
MNVFFGQPWGGLGDNLQFTTLPKLYAEKGYNFYSKGKIIINKIYSFINILNNKIIDYTKSIIFKIKII